MPAYRLPPGAWIDLPADFSAPIAPSGPGLNPPTPGGLNPPTPGGLNPPTPGGLNPPTPGGLNPPTPGGGSVVAGAPMRLNPPQGWSGVDPAWVYAAGPQALLATALRKVQAKIVRPSDPRLAAAPIGAEQRAAARADPLWRWQPEYRMQAVVCEMLGRCVVGGRALWHVQGDLAKNSGQLSLTPEKVYSIAGPAKDFDYSIQIDKVLRAAIEREDRLPEILSQADSITPFFDAITGVNGQVAPHTAELLQVGWSWATHLLMRLKHALAEQRPFVRSALVQPVIATPGHGSLPSGHATISALNARLLSALLYEGDAHPRASQLDRLARRIAFNRVVSGVHFPMDSYAGYELGHLLGDLFIAFATGGDLPALVAIRIKPDSELKELVADASDPESEAYASQPARVGEIVMLRKMWNASKLEIDNLRI